MKLMKPPTRRTFVAMLGAGAALLALPKKAAAAPKLGPPPVEEPAPALPRWIGHC